jgi:hypothetical protein
MRSVLALLALLLVLGGCTGVGGIHRRGDRQVAVTGGPGLPFRDYPGFPAGKGREENTSVAVRYHHFVKDRLALVASFTPFRRYHERGVQAVAGQIGGRYYFAETCLAGRPVGFFGEVLGGFQASDRAIPPGAADFNFLLDGAVGAEMRVSERVSCVLAYRLRHLSNGSIFGDRNPSQDEHSPYVGLAVDLD